MAPAARAPARQFPPMFRTGSRNRISRSYPPSGRLVAAIQWMSGNCRPRHTVRARHRVVVASSEPGQGRAYPRAWSRAIFLREPATVPELSRPPPGRRCRRTEIDSRDVSPRGATPRGRITGKRSRSRSRPPAVARAHRRSRRCAICADRLAWGPARAPRPAPAGRTTLPPGSVPTTNRGPRCCHASSPEQADGRGPAAGTSSAGRGSPGPWCGHEPPRNHHSGS